MKYLMIACTFLLALPAVAAPSARNCTNADEDFLRDAMDKGRLISGTKEQLAGARDYYTLQFSSDSIYTYVLCKRLVDKSQRPDDEAKFMLSLNETYYIDISTDDNGKQTVAVREQPN